MYDYITYYDYIMYLKHLRDIRGDWQEWLAKATENVGKTTLHVSLNYTNV